MSFGRSATINRMRRVGTVERQKKRADLVGGEVGRGRAKVEVLWFGLEVAGWYEDRLRCLAGFWGWHFSDDWPRASPDAM